MPFFLLNLPSYLLRNRQYPGDQIGSSVQIDSIEVSPYCKSFDSEVRMGLRLLSHAFLTFEVLFSPGKIGLTAAWSFFSSKIDVTPELANLLHNEHLAEAVMVVLKHLL